MEIIVMHHNLCIFMYIYVYLHATGTELIRRQDLRARDVDLHRAFALRLYPVI